MNVELETDDKIFEIWEAPNEITMCYKDKRENSLIPEDAELIYSVVEPDYNKAMTKCHEFLEWEEYIPQDLILFYIYTNYIQI